MKHIDCLIERMPELSDVKCAIEAATNAILTAYRAGGKVLLCGNGGSAADCEHIAGELLKGFLLRRTPCGEELARLSAALGEEDARLLQRGIPAVALTAMSGIATAFANDVSPELLFAQEVYALGRAGDVVLGLTTSGNSKNVVRALKTARALGLATVAMTGEGGGACRDCADILITAPVRETYRVQEYHLPIYHAICAEVEAVLFGKGE